MTYNEALVLAEHSFEQNLGRYREALYRGHLCSELIYLVVDDEADEAFGYLVPDFLADAVRRVPELAQAIAELRLLSESEQGQLEILGPLHTGYPDPNEPSQAPESVHPDLLAALSALADEPVGV